MIRPICLASIVVASVVAAPGSTQAQSNGDALAVLGFESASNWQLAAGDGSVSVTGPLTQGAHALEIGGAYWRRVRSSPVAPGVIAPTLRIDAALRTAAAGWETLGIVIEVPTAGLHWQDLGTQSMAGMQPDQVRTFQFSVPQAVRDALAQQHAANVNVTINGAQVAVLDNLDLGMAPPEPEEPPVPAPEGCLNGALQVVDIQADFRDIWLGRESVSTGKRTDRSPTISVRFNQPVDPERVAISLAGLTGRERSDCIDSSGNPTPGEEIHRVMGLSASSGVSAWSMPLAGVQQSAPLGFNVVAFDEIRGIPDSHGAIAAGGDIALQSFSLNQVSQKPFGV